MPKDFEQLAEEAGLGKPLVKQRVPELAETVIWPLSEKSKSPILSLKPSQH